MRAIGAAVTALALDPYPPEGFHRVNITGCAWAGTVAIIEAMKPMATHFAIDFRKGPTGDLRLGGTSSLA